MDFPDPVNNGALTELIPQHLTLPLRLLYRTFLTLKEGTYSALHE